MNIIYTKLQNKQNEEILSKSKVIASLKGGNIILILLAKEREREIKNGMMSKREAASGGTVQRCFCRLARIKQKIIKCENKYDKCTRLYNIQYIACNAVI